MLSDHVRAYIERHGLIAPGGRVLVGVSGGLDSVVLLDVLQRLGYAVAVAHVNYGLRGAASAEDAAFVEQLAASAGLRFYAAGCDPHEEGASLQAAARDQRYEFFGEVALREGYPYVAVGHHADDQAETVLLNLLRGTGLEGLAAMRPARSIARDAAVRLVRPLLAATRADVLAHARTHALTWRTDATNAAVDYRRNVLRHEVLPLLERHFGPGVAERLRRTADHLRAYADAEAAPTLAALFDAAHVPHASGGALRLAVLREAPPIWRTRLILEALARFLPAAPRSAAFAERVAALLDAQPGRRVEAGGGTVWRARETLRFVLPRPSGAAAAVSVGLGESVAVPGGRLQVVAVARPGRLDEGAPDAVFVDRDRLRVPLVVRPWRAGDRMQPLGMEGTKRVSDLLTDARVSVAHRADVLVVCSGAAIVWVVGVRLGHAFRVRAETRQVVRILFEGDEMSR